jgi:protein TonB
LVSLSADPFPSLVPHWQRGAPSEADIARAQLLEHPQWAARPGADDFQRSYPAVAMDRNLEGHVTLDCLVQGNGALKCRVGDETPAGLGFGQAAIDIARTFRAAPIVNGVRSAGKHVHVPIAFRLS